MAIFSTQLQKELKSNPAVKKGCSPKRVIVKKDVKSKVVAKKYSCDGRLMEKFLNNKNSGEFGAKS